MPKRARDKGWNADIGTVTARGFDGVARQRQFADVESHMPKRAEEDFLRLKTQKHRSNAVDGDFAVDQRPVAVVVANRDG